MAGYANGTNTLNATLLSAHDTTLLTVLGSFNITYPECLYTNFLDSQNQQSLTYPNCFYPIYASHIIFEFYNTSDPYLLFYYNGLPFNICGNSNNNCTLSQFGSYISSITNGYTTSSYNQICNVNFSNTITVTQSYAALCWALGGIIIVEVIAIIYLIIRKKKAVKVDGDKLRILKDETSDIESKKS